MIPIIGTISESVKIANLQKKWELKKKEMSEEQKQLEPYMKEAEAIRENRKPSDIDAKLKAGLRLTSKEIDYLRKNNPKALQEYEEIMRERENYEKQLRNCKSKEEVEKIKMTKLGEFMAEAKKISSNANIPKSAKLGMMEKILKKVSAINEEHKEFTESAEYANLPEREEKEEGQSVANEKKSEVVDDFVESNESVEEEGEQEGEQEGNEKRGNEHPIVEINRCMSLVKGESEKSIDLKL